MSKTVSTGMISDEINSITVNSSLPCNSGNYNNCSSRSVAYVVMHYTGNVSDTAKANATYFQTSGRNASAHFFVDDSNIYQSVELRDKAWHCGTSGTYYHSSCRNANSIGIEMCTSGNYKISDTTKKNAAYVCAYICDLIGVTASQVDTYVLRHYDVTHKDCPAQMVSSSSEWTAFKTMVKNVLNTGNADGTTSSSSSSVKTTKQIIKEGQTHANNFANCGITVDGVRGTATKRAGIKVLQTAMNNDYKSGLTVDGIWGTKSEAALGSHYVKKGETQYMVTALEILLMLRGYDGGLENPGVFGTKLYNTVVAYQKAAGLTADGVAGAKTFKSLIS